MTHLRLDEPTDERTFRSGLGKFVQTARQNGIPVERGWECSASSGDEWEVEIVRVISETEE